MDGSYIGGLVLGPYMVWRVGYTYVYIYSHQRVDSSAGLFMLICQGQRQPAAQYFLPAVKLAPGPRALFEDSVIAEWSSRSLKPYLELQQRDSVCAEQTCCARQGALFIKQGLYRGAVFKPRAQRARVMICVLACWAASLF